MDDDIGGELVDGRVQQRVIFQHADGGVEGGGLEQHGVAAVFQDDIVVIGHAVIAVHLEPFIQQQFCQMIADEAGGSGDENLAHRRPLLVWSGGDDCPRCGAKSMQARVYRAT